MKKFRKTVLAISMAAAISNHTVAQTQTKQGYETVTEISLLKIENMQEILKKLQEDTKSLQDLWQKELASERVSAAQAVQIDVQPTAELATAEDGSDELNLNVIFTYSTKVNENNSGVIRFNIGAKTNDYPAGAYIPTQSNACRLTLDFVKTKMETDLLQYLKPGRKVTVKITGETDGAPVRAKMPYKGEYGNFVNKMIFLNGALDDITVTQQTGITSNAQLAFLRAQGVEEFLKNHVPPLQHTKNIFQIYAVENQGIGDEYRKISIELIIHGAFNEKMDITPTPDETFVSDIDQNIPATGISNDNYFALIIANEIYANPVPDVPFAINDGKSFAAYCEKTLGIPARQIIYIENATGNQINDGLERISGLLKTADGTGKAIVYFAGHGIPNAETNEAYIIPTDANPTRFNQLIALNGLYSTLGAVASESVLVVLDACFSGTRRNGEMIMKDTRSVKIRAREGQLTGNVVVMSATDGYQTAMPMREEKHGMFTYWLLKTLQENDGDIMLGEWFEITKKSVSREAILNSAEQTPTVNVSPAIEGSWNNIKIN